MALRHASANVLSPDSFTYFATGDTFTLYPECPRQFLGLQALCRFEMIGCMATNRVDSRTWRSLRWPERALTIAQGGFFILSLRFLHVRCLTLSGKRKRSEFSFS